MFLREVLVYGCQEQLLFWCLCYLTHLDTTCPPSLALDPWRTGRILESSSGHPYGRPEHQDSSQEPFLSSKDLMPEKRCHQKRGCSWHPQGHSELQDSSQEQFLFSNVPMALMTEGKTRVGGGRAQPSRRPYLRMKRKEVGRSPNSCPQGLGKSGR